MSPCRAVPTYARYRRCWRGKGCGATGYQGGLHVHRGSGGAPCAARLRFAWSPLTAPPWNRLLPDCARPGRPHQPALWRRRFGRSRLPRSLQRGGQRSRARDVPLHHRPRYDGRRPRRSVLGSGSGTRGRGHSGGGGAARHEGDQHRDPPRRPPHPLRSPYPDGNGARSGGRHVDPDHRHLHQRVRDRRGQGVQGCRAWCRSGPHLRLRRRGKGHRRARRPVPGGPLRQRRPLSPWHSGDHHRSRSRRHVGNRYRRDTE